jgi:hypothetical protein
MSQRGFVCKIDEGTYEGEVTVWVDEDTIEICGNAAIENAAWREWRRRFGSSIGMAYTACKILTELDSE